MLNGNSNIVMCERDDTVVPMDIHLAMLIDRVYKGTVKEGELDALSAKDVDIMNMLLTRKRAKMKKLYAVACEISK